MFGHKTSASLSSFFDIYNGFRKLAMESLKTILRTTLLLLLVMVSYNSFRFGGNLGLIMITNFVTEKNIDDD